MQAGLAPHEALLLNSLRQLLSAAPAMESTIKSWCAAGHAERRRIMPNAPQSPKTTQAPALGMPRAASSTLTQFVFNTALHFCENWRAIG